MMPATPLFRRRFAAIVWFSVLGFPAASSQFLDDFGTDGVSLDAKAIDGWSYYTGDGKAVMDFRETGRGYASILVDATQDKRGIWWALIRRLISKRMDLRLLSDPRYALRVEARIRVSDAPKRVNLHLNTERTTDFHSQLMEYDIPDTSGWHTISMTTQHFDAVPGDSIYGQMALMDWGLAKYRVDLDYYKVDIVDVDSAGPDLGTPVPYHPPIPDLSTFAFRLPVAEDGMIDLAYPDMNFGRWGTRKETGTTRVLTVSGTQCVLFRWDLGKYKKRTAAGAGVLELTTEALQRSPDYETDFGMIRATEILGGDPAWTQNGVTYDALRRGEPLERVINSQMFIDVDVSPTRGSKTLITVSQPVLQRLLDGKTLGVAVRPLGAIVASFYSRDSEHGRLAPTLYFNLRGSPSGSGETDR